MQTTLVIGNADRGKTTLISRWAKAAASDGLTYVLDADTGQSELGPPATIGLARALPNVERLHDLKPDALFWVGALSPSAAALEHVVASARAAEHARKLGAERLLVDTPGWVSGPAARRWLAALAQALRPKTIVGVGEPSELDGLLKVLCASCGATSEIVAPPDGVVRKPSGMRATRRSTRLARALDGSAPLALPLDAIPTLGATLGTGTPLPPEQLRWCAAALKSRVLHAETCDGVLSIFHLGPLRKDWDALTGPVAYHFNVRSVRPLSMDAYVGVLLGLHDAGGKLLGLGRFTGIEPDRGELLLTTPLPDAARERIALIAFGRLRCAPDGSAPRELKPGEI